MSPKEKEKKIAALEAVKFVKSNDIVGLGTGSTAYYAILEIGRLVKEGLQVQCIPTSVQTETLARSLDIPLMELQDASSIDVTIDGADEFTTGLNLIKGGGAALFREKIVASLTKMEIIIADKAKKVDLLGKFKVPVEVVPLAINYAAQQIEALGGSAVLRKKEGEIVVTDNRNYILDADFGLIEDPATLAEHLNQIEGVLAHGLFIGLTSMIIVGEGEQTTVYHRN
ncbi:MAG: ribose-5-phosphate isomerase RpiA [Pedobacter sp.]|nr:MAG: ribose-5-phosphate isomerase RpiA [Pedobacter sp.]